MAVLSPTLPRIRGLWMREVIVHELQQQRGPDGQLTRSFKKVPVAFGRFLGWGVDYDDLTEGDAVGAGTFSTAIVLVDHGFVKNVPISLVRFDPEDSRWGWLRRTLARLRGRE